MIHVFYFQLYGYNAHLFTNLSEAVLHPHGAVGVAIMVQESERSSNKALRHITSQLNKVNICINYVEGSNSGSAQHTSSISA